MSDGRAEFQWGQTASIMSILANCNRDPKKRSTPYSPDDFNPTKTKKRKPAPPLEVGIDALKVFLPPSKR